MILLGPAMIWMWARASTRYGAISAPNKMAIGMLATAVAFICIAFSAAQNAADPGTKASLFWPLTYYWIVTIGQLAVIPVGNAFISKEAPERLVGTLMGLWMLFGGIGIWLSGQIGALTQSLGAFAVFGGIAVGAAATALAMFATRNWLSGLLDETSI